FEHEEPAQYLNRANQIVLERAVLVSAIDEVYQELKLCERLGQARAAAISPTLPLPPPRWAWPGMREPAHMMATEQWAAGPRPEPWKQAMAEISQVVSRYGPLPDPWKEQFMSEIANVLARYSYAMLNPQPLPPRATAETQLASNPNPSPWRQWIPPGVREPAHPMAMPWWSSDPAQMAAMPPQMLSEIAGVLRRYGYQM
ncbi:MAG: hypothetical protein LUO89_05175, partial [Methanothrix sp.]|nr:hypothetical protein [Methanothrix sp.]